MFVVSSKQWKKVSSELTGVLGANFVAMVSRAPLATGLSASGKVAQTVLAGSAVIILESLKSLSSQG